MKQLITSVALLCTLLACKKEKQEVEHKKQTYQIRIEVAGSTTYYSNVAYYAGKNGGQSNDNQMGTLYYAGYSSGFYVLDLTNKQPCGIDFDLNWLGKDTTIYIPGSSTKTIQLPGAAKGGMKIKAKPLYKCGSSGGDLGWLEVVTPESLPIKFKSIRTEEIKGESDKLKVIFEVEESEPGTVFRVQLSVNNGSFKTIKTIELDKVNPNRTYSVTISL